MECTSKLINSLFIGEGGGGIIYKNNVMIALMNLFPLACAQFQLQDILKSDDLATQFFSISMEMCVNLCYRDLNSQVQSCSTCVAR